MEDSKIANRFDIQQEIIEIEVSPFNQNNESEFLIIQKFIEENIFGITFLKGKNNLNCMFLVHQQKFKPNSGKQVETRNIKVGPDIVIKEESSSLKSNS